MYIHPYSLNAILLLFCITHIDLKSVKMYKKYVKSLFTKNICKSSNIQMAKIKDFLEYFTLQAPFGNASFDYEISLNLALT